MHFKENSYLGRPKAGLSIRIAFYLKTTLVMLVMLVSSHLKKGKEQRRPASGYTSSACELT